MPVSFDTDEVLHIFLSRDEDLPEAQRFQVDCRFLTCRENRRYCRLIDERTREFRAKEPNFDKAAAAGWRALLMTIVQVRNGRPSLVMDAPDEGTVLTPDMIPADRPGGPGVMAAQDIVDALERNLTHAELWRLAAQVPDLLGMADWDKKKLPSLWRSNLEPSAANASAAAGPAPGVPAATASPSPAPPHA